MTSSECSDSSRKRERHHALNHPNILTIFDIGEVDSMHFIATEFVKGETLRARMSATRLSLKRRST